MPYIPNVHGMSCSTCQDEGAKHEEHPVESQTLALAYELNQRDRDQHIRQDDQAIRGNMQPHYLRTPKVAAAVWHEIGIKEPSKKLNHVHLGGRAGALL
jgi:hypothetical protein